VVRLQIKKELLNTRSEPETRLDGEVVCYRRQECGAAQMDAVLAVELSAWLHPLVVVVNHERRQHFDVALAGSHERFH